MSDTNLATNLATADLNGKRAMIWAAVFGFLLVGMPALNSMGLVSDHFLNQTGRYCCFAIAALGVDLIWGFTGMLSLCQAFFFAVGAYCMAMHLTLMIGSESVYGNQLPDFMVWNQITELPLFWKPFNSPAYTVILALTVPALAAGVFGFLVFRSRVRGVYFAIITQALALAMFELFRRNEMVLGGTNGLTDFKQILGFRLAGDETAVAATKRGLYVLSVLAMGASFWLCRWLIRSKLGKVLIAIRDSEHRLRFTGYPIVSYKVFAFMVAAALAGLGGMLYAPQMGIINPGDMSVVASIEMIVWVAVGGRSTLLGAIVGTLSVLFCYSYMTSEYPEYWPYALGAAFIVVVLFFPNGIVGTIQKLGAGKEKSA